MSGILRHIVTRIIFSAIKSKPCKLMQIKSLLQYNPDLFGPKVFSFRRLFGYQFKAIVKKKKYTLEDARKKLKIRRGLSLISEINLRNYIFVHIVLCTSYKIVVHTQISDTEHHVQIGQSPYVYKWVGGWVLRSNCFFSNIYVSL